jgi:hypothetical protein
MRLMTIVEHSFSAMEASRAGRLRNCKRLKSRSSLQKPAEWR